MDRFDENAEKGLNYFLDFCNQRGYSTFSDYDRYHAYDCTVSGKNESIVELKVRDCMSTTYPDCFLEVDKCDKLKYYSKLEDKQPLYVAMYPSDNKMCVWKIDKDKEYDWVWRRMNDKTSSDTPKKVWKRVILLPIEDSIKIDHNFN